MVYQRMARRRPGPPKKELNKELFEDLCKIHCTHSEISNIIKADRGTIESWCQRTYNKDFQGAYEEFAADGKASLRRMQLALAKKNAGMAIWLGKQLLGQRDEVKSDLNPALVAPLVALFEAVKAVQSKTLVLPCASPKPESDTTSEGNPK